MWLQHKLFLKLIYYSGYNSEVLCMKIAAKSNVFFTNFNGNLNPPSNLAPHNLFKSSGL